MSKQIFAIFKQGVFGVGIGAIVTTFFLHLFDTPSQIVLPVLTIWLCASFFFGISSFIFKYLKIKLYLCTIVHFVFIFSIYWIALTMSGFTFTSPFKPSIIFILNYSFFFTLSFIWTKKKSEEMNRLIQKRK